MLITTCPYVVIDKKCRLVVIKTKGERVLILGIYVCSGNSVNWSHSFAIRSFDLLRFLSVFCVGHLVAPQ